MLYLLDANVLIDANRDYYPIGRVDEYWHWLVHHGEQGTVKIPMEIYEEVKEGKGGKDVLATWAKDPATEKALRFHEDVDIALVRRVTEQGYAPDLTDIDIEEIGRDPFLIAYALVDPPNRCVVTTETSRPKAKRQNRHVPDVCHQFGVRPINAFVFGRELDFRTDWRR